MSEQEKYVKRQDEREVYTFEFAEISFGSRYRGQLLFKIIAPARKGALQTGDSYCKCPGRKADASLQ